MHNPLDHKPQDDADRSTCCCAPRLVTEFIVWGIAQPGGSKKSLPIPKRGGGFVVNKNGYPVINTVDDNPKAKSWQAEVKVAAMQAYRGPVLEGPILMNLTFVRVRPKGHFRTGRNSHLLKDDAPSHPTSKPDVLKTARAVEDSLTGLIYRDDAQIVDEHLQKTWGERPCVVVRIEAMESEASDG